MAKTTAQSPTLRDLYPDLNGEELASAAETLDRYIDLVARIAERIAGDPEAPDRFRMLTQGPGTPTMTSASTNTSDQ